MERQVDTYTKLPYYVDIENLICASDVIDALTKLVSEVGDVPIRFLNDGILKNVRFISVIKTQPEDTSDEQKTAIEIH